MDRQDIDALLIGALYGELAPADEARLTAHLDSHPADRTALDDLKSARQKIQESRIFAVQVEPPQAISAVLLQEAHRRAPKRVAAESAGEGWFARFTRSFMSHPAMAAAAMLVVVLGGAGIVWMKKGDSQFASKEVAMESSPASAPVATTAPAEPVVPQGAAAGSGMLLDTAASEGAAAPVEAPTQATANDPADRARNSYQAGLYESEDAKQSDLAQRRAAVAQAENERARDQRAESKSKKDSGAITVGSVERAPKDLEKESAEDREESQKAPAAPAKKSAAKGGRTEGADGFGDDATGTTNAITGVGTVVGGAGGTGYAQPPPPPAPAPTVATPSTGAPGGGARGAGMAGPGVTNAPATRKPAAPTTTTAATITPKTPRSTTSADKPGSPEADAAPPTAAPKMEQQVVKAEPKREDSTLIAWAKAEHNRAVALAKKGDCSTAAKVALSVSNRASGYYAQYMATDRSLKQCSQYIAAERERENAARAKAATKPAETSVK